jgi:HlyD family secretion protein
VLDEDILAQRSYRGPWRAVLLLLVTVVLVGGTIYVYHLRAQASTAMTYTTVPATRGDLAVGVSATGPVSTAASIPLTFKNSGLLTQVLVKPGDTVKAGQVLAREDPADLQHTLDQATAQLAQQQASLQGLQTGPTPQELAVAQQVIDTAQFSLANAQKNVDLTAQQNAKDLQQSQVALANAQASAGNVQNEAAKGEAADQTAIANAQSALAGAQKNAASVQAQVAASTQADQVALQNAEQGVITAQQNLKSGQQQIAVALQADTTAVQNAQQSLQHAQAVASAGTPVQQQQLAQAKNALNTAQIQRDAACNLSDARNSQAGCNAANAAVNTQQTAIDTVNAQIEQTQAQAEQTLAQAQAALQTAQAAAAADKVKQQANSLSAQQAVTQATDALKTAQAALNNDAAKFQGSIVQAQTTLAAAAGALKTAQAALANDQAKDQAHRQEAKASVDTAQAALNDLTGKAAQALQQAQATVDADAQAVKAAQIAYNKLMQPPTQAALAAARAAVQNAQAAMATAQGNLDDATLRSPIAATVAQVNDIAGQYVAGGSAGTSSSTSSNTSTTAFMVLTDLSALQVTAQVNEADMAHVAPGQPVQFTLNAFSGQTFSGKVAEVQPLGTSSNNVVSYNVTCSIDPTTTKLLPGMTTNVTIVTQHASNAVLVPAAALSYAQAAASNSMAAPVATPGNDNATLLVLRNGTPLRRPVQTGLSDGNRTEIIAGLQPGEQVVTGTGAGR